MSSDHKILLCCAALLVFLSYFPSQWRGLYQAIVLSALYIYFAVVMRKPPVLVPITLRDVPRP